MMEITTELDEIINELGNHKHFDKKLLFQMLLKIEEIHKSWSHSILSYQCNVYYKDFQKPPQNAFFSIEWGLQLPLILENFNQLSHDYLPRLGSIGDWIQYSNEEIIAFLFQGINVEDFELLIHKSREIYDIFLKLQDKAMSSIHAYKIKELNPYLSNLIDEINNLKSIKKENFLNTFMCQFNGEISTRDSRIRNFEIIAPIHIRLHSTIIQSLSEFDCIKKLENYLIKIKSHILAHPKDIMEDKQTMTTNHYNIQTVQGFVGNISGGNIQQNIHDGIYIEKDNFDSLADFLTKNGIPYSDVSQLKTALKEDSPPSDEKKFGNNVSQWIGNIVAKASSGIIDIPIATVAGLLTNAISKYYGLS